jgi:endonuclease YncB( thermonuclease family)
MKKLLISLLLISPISFSEEYDYKITRVIDGDTVVIEAPFLPKPLKPEISLRVDGIDTPEKDFRAKCKSEDILAHDATKFTTEKLQNAKSYKIVIKGEDKYFRLLGDIIIDGENLSELLIKNKLAREYHGEKKQSWCTIF